jgi:hypothetical protein
VSDVLVKAAVNEVEENIFFWQTARNGKRPGRFVCLSRDAQHLLTLYLPTECTVHADLEQQRCNEILSQSLKEWHELHPIGHGWGQEISGTCLEKPWEIDDRLQPSQKGSHPSRKLQMKSSIVLCYFLP